MMQPACFETTIDRKNTLSVKYNKSAIASICGNPDAAPFWVADMDFQAPPAVRSAASALNEHGIYGYSNAADEREVFSAWAQRRHNMLLDPSEIVISQGVLTSLATLVELLTDEGDRVIVGLPAYQPFLSIVASQKRNALLWPLIYDEEGAQFRLDWEALDRLLVQAKLLIFCSPHNPTGLTFSEEELVGLCALAAKHQVAIISDEIHADLSFNSHNCLLDAAKSTGCKAAVLMAPSKTFNIAGEHYSLTLFSDPDLQQRFVRRREILRANKPSITATTLALAAYQECDQWVDALIDLLQDRVSLIERYLYEYAPSLSFITPNASFIGLIDGWRILHFVEQDAALHPDLYASERSPSGGILSRFFGHRASVCMNDGSWFGGPEYGRFVRFNFAAPEQQVLWALDRIATAVTEVRKRY